MTQPSETPAMKPDEAVELARQLSDEADAWEVSERGRTVRNASRKPSAKRSGSD
jgi:hypothetical protein